MKSDEGARNIVTGMSRGRPGVERRGTGMYEVICPACRRMVEIPEVVVFEKRRCKCPKCWTLLLVECARPLWVVESSPTKVRSSVAKKAKITDA